MKETPRCLRAPSRRYPPYTVSPVRRRRRIFSNFNAGLPTTSPSPTWISAVPGPYARLRDHHWIATFCGLRPCAGRLPAFTPVVAMLHEFRSIFRAPALAVLTPAQSCTHRLPGRRRLHTDRSGATHPQTRLRRGRPHRSGSSITDARSPVCGTTGSIPCNHRSRSSAVRHMVSSDFPFLNNNPEWIEAYLRHFAPTIPSPVRAALAVGFR